MLKNRTLMMLASVVVFTSIHQPLALPDGGPRIVTTAGLQELVGKTMFAQNVSTGSKWSVHFSKVDNYLHALFLYSDNTTRSAYVRFDQDAVCFDFYTTDNAKEICKHIFYQSNHFYWVDQGGDAVTSYILGVKKDVFGEENSLSLLTSRSVVESECRLKFKYLCPN